MHTTNPHRKFRDALRRANHEGGGRSRENFLARNMGFESFEALEKLAAQEERAEREELAGISEAERNAAQARAAAHRLHVEADETLAAANKLLADRDTLVHRIANDEGLLKTLDDLIQQHADNQATLRAGLVKDWSDAAFVESMGADPYRLRRHQLAVEAITENEVSAGAWAEARVVVAERLEKDRAALKGVLASLEKGISVQSTLVAS